MKAEQLFDSYFKKIDDHNYNYTGNEFKGLSKYCACNGTCVTLETSEMSIENEFMIIIGSVAGGVVFLVVMAILFMKFKKQR